MLDRRTADNVKNILQGPSWRDLKRIARVAHESYPEGTAEALIDEIMEAFQTDLESIYVVAQE